MGNLALIPGLGRSSGGGHGNSLLVFLPGESLWTEEPGGLQSMGLQRVGCEWTFKNNVEGHSLTRVSQKDISIQNLFWCKSLLGTPISSGLKTQDLLMCFSPFKKSVCVFAISRFWK